ncbi:MAG TPA: TetR/AcrR family transcriptional regulator [Streptosporangiaceae bacterium]
MTASQARERLLDAAVERALTKGIVDLSLREIAAGIGTSHRMLLYHFGSREGLLVALVREVERRERQALTGAGALSAADALRLWARLADPELRSQERLFFEIYAHALLGRPGTEGFLEEALEGWITPVAKSIASAGVDQKVARILARLGLAATRGLLLDLLASGDSGGTADAFELLTRLLGQAAAEAGST